LPGITALSCALLLSGGTGSVAQDKQKVPSFELISPALTALVAAQACKGVAIDDEGFNRFLMENGISAADLSARGPHGAEVASLRDKLRRRSRRRNLEFCDQAVDMFGPEGSSVRGLLSRG
jgi:hypothetical protein